jgi:phosphopantothenoylcysteine synthetase/decarboxylase
MLREKYIPTKYKQNKIYKIANEKKENIMRKTKDIISSLLRKKENISNWILFIMMDCWVVKL